MLPQRWPPTAGRWTRRSAIKFSSTISPEVSHALSAETDLLPSLVVEWLVAQAHGEPLREQLWGSAQALERHHRATRVARFREDAGVRREWPQARGVGRTELHTVARAVLRQPRRGGQADQEDGRCACPRLRLRRSLAQ